MGKRSWASRFGLTWVVVVALAGGCAGNFSEPQMITGVGQTGDGRTRLTLWGGVPPEAGPERVVAAWNEAHSDIVLEYVRYVNDDDGNLKLDTALMAGQQVDLYFNYSRSQLERRIEAGVALDLNGFGDYDLREKMGDDAEAWAFDGRYYGLPTKQNYYFVALNKEALEAAELPIPVSWTWDDMRMYASKLSESHAYGWLQHLEPFDDPVDSLLTYEGYTGDDGQSRFDHPLVAHWLKSLKAMMTEDRSTPEYGMQLTSKMPVEQMFLSGEAAMLNIGEWLFRSANQVADDPQRFTIAFAPVPRLTEREEDYIPRGGLGDVLSIHPGSPNVKAAWTFAKWYADGGMVPMAQGGRLPASRDADLEAAMDYFLGGHRDRYDMASLEHVFYGNPQRTFVRGLSQPVLDLRTQEYEKYFLGVQTLEQTLANMKQRHDDYLHSGSLGDE
ncbi:ABC transporter substrate-binding protein [Paenibacillus daejeonensis]|uniref:ABC transporter substrate-binding protein n=1 Tax=Paenibacillus daejeonensis TaxID=135193 RepID=UPI00037C0F18|nr:extracellular solute-binding protein [Paenibacillus daejeonensis]